MKFFKWFEFDSAAKAAREQKRLATAIADLPRRRREIMESSTEFRLQQLAEEERQLYDAQHEARKAVGALVAATPLPPPAPELHEEGRRLAQEEYAIFGEFHGGIPAKTMRVDAVEFFCGERDKAVAKIEKLEKPWRNTQRNVTMGPRIRAEIRSLEAIISEHEKFKRKYAAGARIAKIRARRAEIRAELEQLDEQRRCDAIAAA